MGPALVSLSSASPHGPAETVASDSIGLHQRLAIVFVSAYAVLLLAAGVGQITDPFVHYDDYPALVLDPDGYYLKTLAEGRWFNYWWHLRGIATPAWLNFQLYLAGWALFVSAAALNIFRTTEIRYPALLAALAVVAPQTTLISGWFNTLVPGVWLMAAYAVMALVATPRVCRWLLFLFVPLAIQAYTPYPFLLLAICLLREDRPRTIRDDLATLAAFVTAFALGILFIYTLNHMAHGIFGLALAEWRDPSPVTDFDSLVANLSKVSESLHWTYVMTGFGKPGFSLVLSLAFVASLVVIARTGTLELLRVIAPAAAGLSLLCLHAWMEGILFPFRSTYILWFTMAIALVKAAHIVELDGKRRTSAPLALVLMLALVAGVFARTHSQSLSVWQRESRALALQITATDTIYVYGTHLAAHGYDGSYAQMPRDLQYRLTHLTGVWAYMCTLDPNLCARAAPPFDPAEKVQEPRINNVGAVTYLRTPITVPPR